MRSINFHYRTVGPVFSVLGLVIAVEGGMSEMAMMCRAKQTHHHITI